MGKMKIMKYNILSLFLGIILFSACGSGNKKTGNDHFETGTIIPKVACKNDATITYALYLPKNYNEEIKYPIVYAFDAHAKGNKPVELFSEVAEKYGYIVIGSNNSQNGLSTEATMHIYDVVSNDALGRFSIDRNRVYTAGFSGGSRVASSIAIFKGGISGVIGCSAGFPGLNQPIQFKFDYIGYVGDEDMNYLEMVTLEDALEKSGYRHHLVVFKGTHDWPPKNIIPEAFIWMQANAMKDKKIPSDSAFIQETVKLWKEQADLSEKQGKKYEAYQINRKIISFFDGLIDLSAEKKELKLLEASPEINDEITRDIENRKTELALQTQYVKALGEKNAAWWKDEITRLNKTADNTTKVDERGIIKRVLGYLSLAAYSNSNGYLNAGQLDQAAHFIELYSIIDPTNNEHAYLAACVYAKQNNPDKAFESLNKALELGFSDFGRYQSDTVLARLKNDTRYFEILETLRQGNK
jgi:hypothetical protein